ncbi:MAG: roadblock/LC7 domain-containing protein [Myxococcota bacterium]|nr:roadblock/LC7 domain-containing protein [Myxococcota bacterium]
MRARSTFIHDEDVQKCRGVCGRLRTASQANAVLLVEGNGQYISGAGETSELDTTSIASLTAASVAAASSLAHLLGEAEFPSMFYEGVSSNLQVTRIAENAILIVVFSKQTSLGLVRLRVRGAIKLLKQIFLESCKRANIASPLSNVSDSEIDQIFD